jgi:HAMP domain-containing protein
VSLGKLDAPQIKEKGNDEIGALAASFNRMRRSLDHAMGMLS